MKEITFSASSETLREIACFLSDMAELMDNGGFKSCSHRHIQEINLSWNKKFPNKDIIVCAPD